MANISNEAFCLFSVQNYCTQEKYQTGSLMWKASTLPKSIFYKNLHLLYSLVWEMKNEHTIVNNVMFMAPWSIITGSGLDGFINAFFCNHS